jgi:DNA transformation protein
MMGLIGRNKMPVAAGYHSYVMDLFADFGGVTSRPMFGGYGVFQEGDMFALISGSSLYFKVDDSNLTAFEKAGSLRFKPMPYYEVPADVMEDMKKFRKWAAASIAIGHATAKKKK